jgi:Icc-related predicted phosphoesterase
VKSTRIFFVSDLHGSEICFRKFINAGKHYRADVIISGGDVTGKMIVPMIDEENGTYEVTYLGSTVRLKTETQAQELMKNIRNAGFYPIILTREQIAAMTHEDIDQLFNREMSRVLSDWVALADDRLRGTGIRCFMMPGNDDRPEVDSSLESSECVVNADGKIVDLGPVEMVSTGWANMTPWNCPRDVEEDVLAAHLTSLVSGLRDPRKSIFNFHVPPYDSLLDTAPLLDETLRPRLNPGGGIQTAPVGSIAVRQMIETYQPVLGLHGHIHEGRGIMTIGSTTCINPGSEYQAGILRGAVIVISKDGKIVDRALTAG